MPLLPQSMTSLTHMCVFDIVGPIPPAAETRPLERLLQCDAWEDRGGAVANELLGRLQSVTRVRYAEGIPLPRSLSMLTTLRSVTWSVPYQVNWMDLGPVASFGRLTSLYLSAGAYRATVHVPTGVALPALRELVISVECGDGVMVELPLFSRAVAPRLRCLALVCDTGRKPLFSLAHLAQWSLPELRVLCLESMSIGDARAQAAVLAAHVAAALPALAIVHLHDCFVAKRSKAAVAAMLRGRHVCRSRRCSLGRRVDALFRWHYE